MGRCGPKPLNLIATASNLTAVASNLIASDLLVRPGAPFVASRPRFVSPGLFEDLGVLEGHTKRKKRSLLTARGNAMPGGNQRMQAADAAMSDSYSGSEARICSLSLIVTSASLLVTRSYQAPGLTTSNKCIATSNKGHAALFVFTSDQRCLKVVVGEGQASIGTCQTTRFDHGNLYY